MQGTQCLRAEVRRAGRAMRTNLPWALFAGRFEPQNFSLAAALHSEVLPAFRAKTGRAEQN